MTTRSTVYLVADKWVYLVCLRLILPEMLLNSFWKAILLLLYSLFSFISLHLVSHLYLVSNNSIMLVNILLFQHYSCQICIPLFSKLCQRNRLRPTSYIVLDWSYATTHLIFILIPYKQKYWWTLYLAACSENTVGRILNWLISLLYREKPMLLV